MIYADFEYKVANLGKEGVAQNTLSGKGSSRGLWLPDGWSHITGSVWASVLVEALATLSLKSWQQCML